MFAFCVNALHPSQQSFSDVRAIPCLLWLDQIQSADKVSCSRTQQSDSSEFGNSNPLIPRLTLDHVPTRPLPPMHWFGKA